VRVRGADRGADRLGIVVLLLFSWTGELIEYLVEEARWVKTSLCMLILL
jgi:hypothetical protein